VRPQPSGNCDRWNDFWPWLAPARCGRFLVKTRSGAQGSPLRSTDARRPHEDIGGKGRFEALHVRARFEPTSDPVNTKVWPRVHLRRRDLIKCKLHPVSVNSPQPLSLSPDGSELLVDGYGHGLHLRDHLWSVPIVGGSPASWGHSRGRDRTAQWSAGR